MSLLIVFEINRSSHTGLIGPERWPGLNPSQLEMGISLKYISSGTRQLGGIKLVILHNGVK